MALTPEPEDVAGGIEMRESEIVEAIEKRVRGSKKFDYSIWTIGITNDPERRKTEHGDPTYWIAWKADTETNARNVESHFLEKGMKGGAGGGEHPTHVYVF